MHIDWYRSPEGIKNYFEKSGQFKNLDSQLRDSGIIYEGDFGGLVTSNFVEHSHSALNELFLDEDCEFGYVGGTVSYPDRGWMYFLYDSN
ncbi:hypothetical protein ACFKJT_00600, partial [Streptococcus agalactiae]|uniref:hypothetical protein n=1 Tax=Streptococcus agalactiae TaxID=1311 RepID=UPI00363C2140